MSRKTFTTPSITDLGSVEALTLANGLGNRLDRTFDAGTNIGDVTRGEDFPPGVS